MRQEGGEEAPRIQDMSALRDGNYALPLGASQRGAFGTWKSLRNKGDPIFPPSFFSLSRLKVPTKVLYESSLYLLYFRYLLESGNNR
jgi:hypothetical protein